MNFNRAITHLAVALGSFLVVTDAALAATATGTFPVTATVTNTCTVSSTGVAFGSYTGAVVTNTANNIVVTCNKGVTIASFFIGNGANPSGTQKQMAFGAERLAYNIDVPTGATFATCPAAGSNSWNGTTGPANATLTTLFATTGGAKNMAICASIPAAQYPAGGTYTDTITMTLTY
jgi:spore coat protein U-like protein